MKKHPPRYISVAKSPGTNRVITVKKKVYLKEESFGVEDTLHKSWRQKDIRNHTDITHIWSNTCRSSSKASAQIFLFAWKVHQISTKCHKNLRLRFEQTFFGRKVKSNLSCCLPATGQYAHWCGLIKICPVWLFSLGAERVQSYQIKEK